MALKYVLFGCLIIGFVKCQSDDLSSAVSNLPPELQGKVDQGQVEEIKNKTTRVFKEKCEKNGGPDAFNVVEAASQNFMSCIKALVDQNVLEKEIEEAKPEGKVDEVFKKYCDKTPSFKECFYNVTEAAKPCFDVDEKKSLKTVYNITERLAEFVCFKGGDRIALFIAEGGPECFKDKQEAIQNCFNSTFSGGVKIDPNNFSVDSLPTVTFDKEKCGQLTKLQKCVVTTLETCEQPTSANIVESLFKFVRKETPCDKYPDTSESKHGAATTMNIAAATLLTAAVASLLV